MAIDLGQALTAQERRDLAGRLNPIPWPCQAERAAKNKAIESDLESDWQAYHALRAGRLAACMESKP